MPRRLRTKIILLLLTAAGLLLAATAARKPFWYDEILTLRVAAYPIGPEMWKAKTAGFDFNPPAIEIATNLSEQIFGRGPLASRLPPILGGLVVLFCAFQVASRQGGTEAGLWAVFLVLLSGLFPYFYEARGYALMLAGTMIAWASWQSLGDDGRYYRLKLAGISCGLALALASHMFAIVTIFCLLAAAVARWMRTRKLQVGAIAAMILPAIVALSYPPIVASSRGIQFNRNYSYDLVTSYWTTLRAMPALLVGGTLFLGAVALYFPSHSEPRDDKSPLLEDFVAAVCFILAPLPIYAVTRIADGVFYPRYGLVAGLGLSFAFAHLLALLSRRARIASYAVLFVLSSGLVALAGSAVLRGNWTVQRPMGADLQVISKTANRDEPVIYADGLLFLQADFYSTPEEAKRIAYVADRALATEFVQTDVLDAGYILGRESLRIQSEILSYSDLKQRHRSFWLLSDSKTHFNWLSDKLRADGAEIRALNVPNTRICHVTFVRP